MRKIIVVAIACLLFMSAIYPKSAYGIGQITKPINITNALRGQAVESILTIYNTGDKEGAYKLEADGDIKNWTTFYSIDNANDPISGIKIPANTNIKAVAKFNIPNDAQNGIYSGEVAVIDAPLDKGEGKVNVLVGTRVGRQVTITVTDEEIFRLSTSIIPNKYDLKSNEPLKIRIIYDNRGNTSISPQVQIKIAKDGKTFHNAIYPFPEDMPRINSMSMKEVMPVEIQTTGFEDGKYEAKITIIIDENNKYDKQFSFRIRTANNALANLGFMNVIYGIGVENIIFVSILLAALIISIFILKSKKAPSRKQLTEDET